MARPRSHEAAAAHAIGWSSARRFATLEIVACFRLSSFVRAAVAVLAGPLACAGAEIDNGFGSFTGSGPGTATTASSTTATTAETDSSTGEDSGGSASASMSSTSASTDPTAATGTDAGESSGVDTQADTGPECVPTEELCDGVDNDCDNDIDEDVAEVGSPCDTGQPGVCADGSQVCRGGVLACQGPSAGVESCNGLDDDCDGNPDDGNPGGGAACDTGQPGVCAAGTQQCQGGGLACVQTTAAGAETCGDGLDNDCDGTADDGCNNCSHDICLSGAALVSNCDPCVTQICAVDSFCCDTSWDGLCVDEVGSICGIVC